MDKVKQAIEKATKDFAPVMDTMDGPSGELMEAACKLSTASLQCFSYLGIRELAELERNAK